MKIELDEEANCAYIYVQDKIRAGEVKRTRKLNGEVIVDFGANNKLLGIEVLNAEKYLSRQTIKASVKAK